MALEYLHDLYNDNDNIAAMTVAEPLVSFDANVDLTSLKQQLKDYGGRRTRTLNICFAVH